MLGPFLRLWRSHRVYSNWQGVLVLQEGLLGDLGGHQALAEEGRDLGV